MPLISVLILSSLSLCLTLCVNVSLWAAEISLVAPHFTGLINKQHSGPYQNLLQEAAGMAKVDFVEDVIPEKRAIYMFRKRRYDCIYSYANVMRQEFGVDKIVTSFPLGVFKEYMMTLRGTPALTSTAQLQGGLVGATLGTEVWDQELLASGVKIEYAATDEQNIKKLESGRIQVFLAYLPDVNQYLYRLSYSPAHPIRIEFDQITCHRTPKTEAFVDAISKALREMKRSGRTAQLLGEHYLEFDDTLIP
ncbi:substrate-binding periplasmic protein [Shewanella sp. KCT]|uniref:substrate-binding periplasmic protein n=1 Tax=Shewanella sp. KCT TaxID=2569535 RepID=UPI0011838D07|nr:ABC transporter substrate-binding protein [Shewanella sp. KCT]TVP15657.1 hypothetical protein AYI87_04075 [Shewanella sp. KCT]